MAILKIFNSTKAYLKELSMKLVRDWMNVAKNLADKEKQEDLYVQILDHLAFSSAKIGDSHRAFQLNEELSKLRPDNSRYRGNTVHYK